jgi:hypothetical protein
MRKTQRAEKRQIESDAETVIPGSENCESAGSVARDEDNRRLGLDRRNFHYTACIPERRSGKERRN